MFGLHDVEMDASELKSKATKAHWDIGKRQFIKKYEYTEEKLWYGGMRYGGMPQRGENGL